MKTVSLVSCWAFVASFGCYVLYLSRSPTTDWNGIDVATMKHHEMLQYIQWTNNASSCKLERDFGGNVDGRKSVCLDPQVGLEPENCLVYSFGVNHEWTFDEEMARYGCQVYAFDPMAGLSYNRSDKIHVYNYGLSFKTEISVQNWTVMPLKKLYKMLEPVHGRIPISYLKYDLEDGNLRVVPDIVQTGMLANIRQLALEVHIEPEGTIEDFRDMVEVLQAMEELGMVRFASNGIPSSQDWLQPLGYEGYLDYDISWYNSNLLSKS
ncbi:methyltransferase-like protein 24 [Daphnia magna]|uniref:Methyltransferase domain-containing protein n=2 Tax=Daphnia magna TaxID=35525 RepID=A0ABQ9ZQC8_9CRUS|nr:methyltransferase-like protein 24 [Daphnia magna]KAK4014891.1 hypothetical protein OUZ56_027403 [Daphnia magna]